MHAWQVTLAKTKERIQRQTRPINTRFGTISTLLQIAPGNRLQTRAPMQEQAQKGSGSTANGVSVGNICQKAIICDWLR